MFYTARALFAPDAQPSPTSGGTPTGRPRRRKDLLPESDAQLADLATAAAAVWRTESWLTLRYTTAATFDSRAAEYRTALEKRRAAGGERPTAALRIGQLDEQINEHLYRVKEMLTTKYDKKQAPAYYAKMGIEKQSKQFIIPRERSKRAAALAQLLKGLDGEGFVTTSTTYPYGTAFWQPIATEYAQLIKDLTDDTGTISESVGEKDMLRDELEQTLRSIARVLEGNYPVTKEYKAQLRLWGFQKENY